MYFNCFYVFAAIDHYVRLSCQPQYTLMCLIAVPPLINFLKIFLASPPLLLGPLLISFCAKAFQNVLQTSVLNKSGLLAILLYCLHFHDHRHLIYEHRMLHSSIILDFEAFFYSPRLLNSSNVSSPPRLFRPYRQLGT